MDGMPPYDPASERRRIDWDLVRRVLDNISATCGRPTIHKGMHAGYHIAAIAAALPDSGFVHLRRPALDVAASLAAARLHYYGSLDSWWSLYTPNFAHLRHEPWWRQIAAQVTWLERCHLQALSELPRQRVKTITYSALCADPLSVVSMVQALIADHCGVQVPQVGAAPASFAPSRPRIDAEMRDLLERGLAEIGSETEN
jgi:hypothetical protein